MEKRQILIATQNKGKLVEFEELLQSLDYEVVSPSAVLEVANLEVEETGKTFEENALLKAREFALKSGMLAIADDSGLEVEELNGFPGVMSDRWHQGTASQKNQALLEKMQNLDNRNAKFVSCIALFDPKIQKEVVFRGEIEGEIALEPSGTYGFGYDPIFVPFGFDLSFAELGKEVKNEISHRKQALNKLKNYLKSKSKTA